MIQQRNGFFSGTIVVVFGWEDRKEKKKESFFETQIQDLNNKQTILDNKAEEVHADYASTLSWQD